MNVMLMTLIFIKVNNLNIFFKLLKITLTVNDLKLNESLNMLMKQDMNMSLLIITLTRTCRFSNSLRSRVLRFLRNNRVLYVLISYI